MKLSKKITLLALVFGSLPVAALAGDAGTVYTQLSTNGLGLGYAASVSKDFAVRGQYNTMKFSFTGDSGGVAATNADIQFNSLQVLGDWYPMDGGFRLTGGVAFNNNKVTFSGSGKINDKAATVDGEIKMSDSVSPYLGIGYATRPKDAKGFGFNLDLGAMFQNPKATLTATGTTATAAEIESQRLKLQEAADLFKVMPVFGLGISYSF